MKFSSYVVKFNFIYRIMFGWQQRGYNLKLNSLNWIHAMDLKSLTHNFWSLSFRESMFMLWFLRWSMPGEPEEVMTESTYFWMHSILLSIVSIKVMHCEYWCTYYTMLTCQSNTRKCKCLFAFWTTYLTCSVHCNMFDIQYLGTADKLFLWSW